MNTFTRGMRNAFRNGIRTVSIVIIVGLSIGLALTMLVANKAVSTKINSVKSSIGNTITISPAGARGFEGGGDPLTADQIKKVGATTHVVSVTQTLQDRLDSSQTNLVSSVEPGQLGRRFNRNSSSNSQPAPPAGGGQTSASGTVILPVTVTGTNNLSGTAALAQGGGTVKVTSGKEFNANSSDNVALVGTALAKKNNLSVGSTFTAYGTTVTVSGIFDAGNNFSNSNLIMPLAAVQKLSGQTGEVTNVTAQVDSITNVDATTQALKSSLGDSADVVSQADRESEALTPLENIKSISFFSLVGAVVAGAVIILLTMLMIVRERRREIGVLKAIGASGRTVTTQFVIEAITFTSMGAVLGLIIGVVAANPVTKLLVSNSANSGGMGGPGGGFGRVARMGGQQLTQIQAAVGWDLLLYGLLAALVIAIVGSAIPAWLISKVRPAEVMRAE